MIYKPINFIDVLGSPLKSIDESGCSTKLFFSARRGAKPSSSGRSLSIQARYRYLFVTCSSFMQDMNWNYWCFSLGVNSDFCQFVYVSFTYRWLDKIFHCIIILVKWQWWWKAKQWWLLYWWLCFGRINCWHTWLCLCTSGNHAQLKLANSFCRLLLAV